jgi:acetyl esterase/lipase
MIELKLDAASPKRSQDTLLPAVIFVHGGGFRDGSKDAGIPLAIAFAQGGYLAVTIDYRLSGVARFPAAVHDCKAAVRFLRANAKELGIDPWRIGIVGPSAGGHLSALIGTSGNDGALEGELEPSGVSSTVQCVVDFSGPIDFTRFDGPVRREYLTLWLGDDLQEYRKRAKEASPLTYLDDADPPFLLIHGTADEIVPLEQAQLFNAALIDAGIETEYLAVKGAGHVLRKPELFLRMGAFFDRHLGGRAAAVFRKRLDQQPKPTDGPTPAMKRDR